MAKKKKVKIYWGRIAFAAVVLLAFILLIVMVIKGIVKAFGGDDTPVSKTVSSVSESSGEEINPQNFKVFLDPGHGGEEDPGALSLDQTRYEKDDDLKIGLLVRDELINRGIEVEMSRDTDVFVELDEIVRLANESDADLFVSLHRNSADVGNGVEAWVNWNAPKADTLLADNILNALDESTISDNRGVEFGYTSFDYTVHVNYQVNEQTTMPSCLLELLFITDEEDNALFDTYCEEYAEKIADGIEKTAYQLAIADDPDNEVTPIDLDSYSYPDAPETVDVEYTSESSETSSSNSNSATDFIDSSPSKSEKDDSEFIG